MGNIKIEELPSGKRRVRVFGEGKDEQVFETAYPSELIEVILKVKGTRTLRDEIAREEADTYTRICLEKDIFGYVDKSEFDGARVLDFGCGAGASTIILARMLPNSKIVGVELLDELLEIARARATHYGFTDLQFMCSPSGDELPANIGQFDYIVLSAVYEHLLPEERESVLHQLWSVLKPKGLLFIDQTPFRYFPFEGHTTHLPFVNYLPDKLALGYARMFSKRVGPDETWKGLLRRGIRGGSVRGIKRTLSKVGKPVVMKPTQMGFQDRIDVWYAGYAVSISRKYPWAKPIQFFMKYFCKMIYLITGVAFLPALSVTIMKEE